MADGRPARKAPRRPDHRAGIVAVIALLVLAILAPSAHAGQQPPRLEGYGGQFTELHPVRQARLTPFWTGEGEEIDLSRFRGKVVLLNFWATWCAPCIHEMPALDALAAEMAGDDLAVVPVSIDERGLAAVAPFHRRHGLDHLEIYLDPDGYTAYDTADNPNDAAFALYGLPVTYLVDHEGRVHGYIPGAVDWHSNEAKALIRHYTSRIGN